MIKDIIRLRKQTKEQASLIHCITNPISIHDCANVILAAGAKPIMAEHPQEVHEITANAGALLLNLGNITDVRMESMEISLRCANSRGIPVLLDLVGVACSSLRFHYASRLLDIGGVTVLKGNMSELLAIAGQPSHSIGIDAGQEDVLNELNQRHIIPIFQALSRRTGAVILVSGQTDLIINQEEAYLLTGGHPMMGSVTGTGCMLGALCTAFLPVSEKPLHAVLLGTVMMGIAGETAVSLYPAPGHFQIGLLDQLYLLEDEEVLEKSRIQIYR